MEISSFLNPISCSGEGKYEMLELNRRLESYLNHVKLLEEENQLLWGEIQAIRRNQDTGGQRKAQDEAHSLARKELQNAWREKDRVELEVSILLEEIEELNILRQREKSAHTEIKRKVEVSRKALEDEKRMQIWLREQAAHLENEVSQRIQVHQDDLAALKSSGVCSKPMLMPTRHSQTFNLQGLGEEYSKRATQAWHEAASVYQTQMKKLEDSLDQTRAQLTCIKQENKQSQLLVQDLAKDLESAKFKRQLMEKNMAQQTQRQKQDLQNLQVHMEALEAEKVDLGEQIGELVVESRNLLQIKMSLNLEVAAYRNLLDNESLRISNQSSSKRNRTPQEGIIKSTGIPRSTQALSYCLFSSPLNTTSRSITHKANLMTPTPTWNLTPRTPRETLKRPQATKEVGDTVRVEKQKLETSTTKSNKPLSGGGNDDIYRAEEEVTSMVSGSASEVLKAVDEPESILNRIIKEDLQAELGPMVFTANELTIFASLAGSPQTPESVSCSQQNEEAKSSKDGDEEETDVSNEIAQISHAPVSAWEEKETVIPEERERVSKLELKSEDVAENSTNTELERIGEGTNNPDPVLEIPHLSAESLSPVEDDSDILTWGDVKEDVIHFIEEESLKTAPEIESKSVKGSEEKREVEHIEWCDIEELEGNEFSFKVQEEENETEQEIIVEESKEDEVNNGDEQRMIKAETGENFGEQKAEMMVNAYEKDNVVDEKAELVIDTYEKDKLPELYPDVQSDEDESANISASWRTDPGEADSYAHENTLADTRPLIHYKSDEDTEAKIPSSHPVVSEPTYSEDQREKHEEGSQWSQIIAKRFDTMEDLSEEPELGSLDDIIVDESVQAVLRESMGEEAFVENESGDMESHVKTLMADALVEQSESDLRNKSNKNSQAEEEPKIENSHLSTFLLEKQEESSELHDWSASFYSETRKMNEQQALLNPHINLSDDVITEHGNNAENWDKDSIEGESKDKKNFNSPLLEPFQEQVLEEEPCEEALTGITHSDVPRCEIAGTEQVHPKEEDVQSALSMRTHADFTDDVSLHSHPDSQLNTNNSDLEEPNSSEDESPNSSQCSQQISHIEMQNQQLDEDSAAIIDGVSITDLLYTDLLSGEPRTESSGDYTAPQAEDLENKNEQRYEVDSSSGRIDENAARPHPESENLDHEMSASYSVHSTEEECDDGEIEKKKDNLDIFQTNTLKEECQTNGKENDFHGFFSSSMKEDIWSAKNLETATTYDPNDQTESEKSSHDVINPNQTMTFKEDWGNLERPTNSKPEKDMSTSMAQSMEKDDEQKMPQTKEVQCRDVKDAVKETVTAEDSTDEGDSWSSGEE